MEKKIKMMLFDVADVLRGTFSYEEFSKLCIYFVFIKYVLDNEKLSYDKETFALQRMYDKGELNAEVLIKISTILEEQYGFPSSSLVDLAETYLRVNEIDKLYEITNHIMKILGSVSFKNESVAISNGLIDLLYSSALSFGRIMGEKISKKSVSMLIKSLIKVEDNDKFADLTYGYGISTLEITEGKKCNIIGYEINRTTVAVGIMLLIISEKKQFRIHAGDVMQTTIERESFDKIVTMPPLGMKVRDVRGEYEEILTEYNLPKQNYNMEVYMMLKGLSCLKPQGKSVVTVSKSLLSASTQSAKLCRKFLVENYLQAVIQLPGLYYGTSIPTVILILQKNRLSNSVQFIDAFTNDFFMFSEKSNKNHLELTETGIEKITQIYHKKQNVEGISHITYIKEFEDNNFSLVPEKYIKVVKKREYISNEEIDKRLESLYDELRKIIEK